MKEDKNQIKHREEPTTTFNNLISIAVILPLRLHFSFVVRTGHKRNYNKRPSLCPIFFLIIIVNPKE